MAAHCRSAGTSAPSASGKEANAGASLMRSRLSMVGRRGAPGTEPRSPKRQLLEEKFSALLCGLVGSGGRGKPAQLPVRRFSEVPRVFLVICGQPKLSLTVV
eukprot:scaffold62516_cov58-Phaeocystis_antarctica.AAC.2